MIFGVSSSDYRGWFTISLDQAAQTLSNHSIQRIANPRHQLADDCATGKALVISLRQIEVLKALAGCKQEMHHQA